MKNKFQSKAVPRGTRTIWRYLSALILLFSLSIGQMWGADLEIPLTNLKLFPLDYGLVKITDTENTTVGSNQLQVSKKTAKFKVSTTLAGFYLKSISFTDANPSKNGGFTCDEGSYMSGPTENVYTYTAPNTTTTEANFSLIGSGGTAKMGTIIVTLSTNEQVERLTAFGSVSDSKIPFTSSAATSNVELSVPASNAVSTSSSRISIGSGGKHLIVSTKNSKVLKNIIIPKYQQSTYVITGSSDPAGTYNKTTNVWTPTAATNTSVDLTLTVSSTVYSQEIFVIYSNAASYTVTLNPNEGGYASTPDGWTADGSNIKKTVSAGALTIPEPARANYDFAGWKSGTTSVALTDGKLTVSKDTTLVAQWAVHTTSSDATLSALSVAGCTFNETFDPATFAYTVDLPFYGTMPAVGDVTATPNDANAKTPAVSISSNKITIACEAEDGTKKNYTITVTIAPAPAASSSINIEQLVLDNSTKYNIGDALDAAHIAYVDKDALDSLKDQSGRNEPYLGLKFKKSSSKITVVVPAEKVLNIKWGNISTAIKVKINGESQSDITTTPTGSIYHLDAANIVRQVEFSVAADKKTIVLKQIMVGENIQSVQLPWLVTYDAGEHGTCATAKETWKGTALTLPSLATLEDGWSFDGWNDGANTYAAGASYNPTADVTLTAQYTALASPFDLTALTYKIGEGAATNVGYVDGTFTYNIELPYKPSYDAITVAPTLKVGTSSIKEGAVLTVSSLPGAATFTVVEAGSANEKLYTINFSKEAKDGTSLIKAVATATAQDITGTNLTGAFKGAAHIETASSYKLNEDKYFMVQLVAGQNFQAGDIVKINVSAVNDCNGFTLYSSDEFTAANLIIDTHTNSDAVAKISAGINEVELPSSFLGSNKLYVARADGADKYLNAGINQVEVTRVLNPQLLAITINERAGVIDPLDDKHFNVQIPYEADLANLTVVPTIAWNAPAAENSIVVNDGGAWVEGNNTYKLTDKDDDYTVYTLTLTRDVQKFVVTYFDGETNLGTEEVEKNGHPTATGIGAPTKKGKIFLGWNQSSTATAAEDLNEITIIEAKNLYAIYEDIDCSGTGVKFSMTPKANELTENYEPKGDEERDYAEYATLVGGKVFINNVAASEKRISVLKETSHIKFEGGDDGYIHVELDCPLNEKDTIKIENDQKWQVSVAKGSGYVAKLKTDKYHVVPAAWDGKYDFYIKRAGSSLTISGIQVVRPAKFDVSFNMMGHGTQIADIEDVIEGSKITAPTAPTDADYSFAGWYKENTLENEWKFDVDVVETNTTLLNGLTRAMQR